MMDVAKSAGFKRANHSDKGDVKAYVHPNGSKLHIGPISWEHSRGDYHSGGGYGAKSLSNYIKGGMKYRTDDSESSHHDKKYGERMMFNDSTGREADGPEPNYVKPRYTQIKPEGYIDPRDVVKTGQQGGGHSGGSEKESRRSAIEAFGARRPATMEGKRGWTERQRSMHSKMGKQIAGSN